MPTILMRIFLLYNLFNSLLLSLVPKKLRPFLSSSWYANQAHAKTPASSPVLLASSSSSPPTSLSIRRMDPIELKRLFQMFDHNGDGCITEKELGDSLENLGIFISDKELKQMIERVDMNGDRCVDIAEFADLYDSIMAERDEEEDMREAFKVFDKNGDGFISVEELKTVLASLGLRQGKTEEDCKRMIVEVDVDGDGVVNFNEFKQMMKGGGFQALH